MSEAIRTALQMNLRTKGTHARMREILKNATSIIGPEIHHRTGSVRLEKPA